MTIYQIEGVDENGQWNWSNISADGSEAATVFLTREEAEAARDELSRIYADNDSAYDAEGIRIVEHDGLSEELKTFAESIGKEHAASFRAEFGEDITPETAGDWDATSLGEAWIDARRSHDAHSYEWTEFRVAYLQALYGAGVEVA